ncbi:efflux RND transporter periplasmic adaptor subunit [candidate division KSB1 bacterium]|nr:efflux RND transporter periplasmic adaptor subunit [candidate division KSB1 bacterium]NIR69519.1 efflux RND transporter periplasmic adaptor subunit [candidate division KSB1 bacterium]NIS24287.1 efflux RND transporter periplasmic adaptor subunit [candidate division KSB1 bacterium]NIT71202.1 efflux RND transporter periplasmic adaptor subunit [candidate division KSB1 bacterium]NIU24906.1 efflux RND transporter periplasmic adaptor subunit [candidate division KSB1 bacterium]
MSRKAKIWTFVGVVVIIAAFVVINLKKVRGDTIEVQTAGVKRGDITQLVSGTGKIQPEKEVDISAYVSGEITNLRVQEGNYVKQGQLLVELDRTRYVAALDRAKSDLKSAKASLKKARSELTRAKELYEKKLFSDADLEGTEANFELAESKVEQAAAVLKQAEDDLAKTRIVSPMAGTVAKLNKEEGEIALGSQFQADVIMTVADLTRMEMAAEIDENDVVLVSLKDSAEIEVDALPERIFSGYVSEIAHTATTRGRGTQEEVTNFEVKIFITDNVQQLRPGMSATVDIQTETHEDVLYVPIQAITMREPIDTTSTTGKFNKKTWRRKKGTTRDANAEIWGPQNNGTSTNDLEKDESEREEMVQVVFVAKDEHAEMVPVDTGISSERNVEIVKGLEEGQEIITGSFRALSKLLKDGSRIEINNKVKKFRSE